MMLDSRRLAASYRALKANQPPIHIPDVKPIAYALDYGMTPNEVAMEHALIRGALRVHPNHRDEHGFVGMLTPIQRTIYARMPR